MKLKIKPYDIIHDNVWESVIAGIRKYYKHSDPLPTDYELQLMRESIHLYVMNGLSEIIDFEQEPENET